MSPKNIFGIFKTCHFQGVIGAWRLLLVHIGQGTLKMLTQIVEGRRTIQFLWKYPPYHNSSRALPAKQKSGSEVMIEKDYYCKSSNIVCEENVGVLFLLNPLCLMATEEIV